MNLMRQNRISPDEIAYGAALEAFRRVGNSTSSLACLQEMLKARMSPAAVHYNQVIRALRAEVIIASVLVCDCFLYHLIS